MKPRLPTFNPAQHQWIRDWHAAMRRSHERKPPPSESLRHLGLGDRARLRRTAALVDLASDEATLLLVHGLIGKADQGGPDDSGDTYARLGVVAGVLAVVDEDERKTTEGSAANRPVTLAARLGRKSDGRVPMSELRFRQMRSATNPEDLLRLWRRALHLVNKRADVAMLADDLYTWLLELEGERVSPSNSARFHWAYDYYQQPREKEAGGAFTPESEVKE